MLLARLVDEAAVGYVKVKSLLSDGGDLYRHSDRVKIGIIVGKDGVGCDAVHAVYHGLGRLPRPSTEILSEELNIRELILKGYLTDLGRFYRELALDNGKCAVMYYIVYIFIGIIDSDLVLAYLRRKGRRVDSDAEQIHVVKAIYLKGKLGYTRGVGYDGRGDGNRYGRLFDLVRPLIDAEVVVIYDLESVLIGADKNVCRAAVYGLNTLDIGSVRLTVIIKFINNIAKVKLLFLNVYSRVSELIYGRVRVVNESYAELLLAYVTDRGLGRIEEFPISVLV